MHGRNEAATHEKRRAPIAATQFPTVIENAKMESAFLPIGKNTFPTTVGYGIVWRHHHIIASLAKQRISSGDTKKDEKVLTASPSGYIGAERGGLIL